MVSFDVASLVRQRSIGEIDRDDFFDRLSAFHGAASCNGRSTPSSCSRLQEPASTAPILPPNLRGSATCSSVSAVPEHRVAAETPKLWDFAASTGGDYRALPWATSPTRTSCPNSTNGDVSRCNFNQMAEASCSPIEPTSSVLEQNRLASQTPDLRTPSLSGFGTSRTPSCSVASQGSRSSAGIPVFDGAGLSSVGTGLPGRSLSSLSAPSSPRASQSSEPETPPLQRHRPMPNSIAGAGPSFSNFAHRSAVWDLRRSLRCQELKRQRDQHEVAECSFHPAVSSRAPRYNGNLSCISSCSEQSCFGPEDVQAITERLAKPVTAPRLTQESIRWKEHREQENLRECTFRPNVSKSSKTFRRSSSVAAPCAGSARPRTFLEEAPTFAPQTLGAKAHMRNAKAYLQDNVFSRLSQLGVARSSGPQQCDAFSSWHEASMTAVGHGGTSATTTQRPSLVRSQSDTSLTDGAAVARFLERQNCCEVERRGRLQQMKAETAPSWQPEICERSARLAERRQYRLAVGASSGLDSSCRQNAAQPAELETECTFRPSITPYAAQRDARSIEDLSLGDQRRREARLAKLRARAEVQEASSFAPKVNDYEGIGGRLRIRDDPQTLLERITVAGKAADKRRERDLKRLEDQEMAGCTFSPQVKPAPVYIQRMAASHRAARVLKEKDRLHEENDTRPNWQF